jgi:hypothetical protein
VLPGIEEHSLERHAMGGLDLRALGDRQPGGAEALDEFVANALEFAEAKHPGLTGSPVGKVEAAHVIGGHKGVGELPLEACDLCSERAARSKLVSLTGL